MKISKSWGTELKGRRLSKKGYSFYGLDIEADATDATPFLICAKDSTGKKEVTRDLNSLRDVIEFLTLKRFRNLAINGFWNLGYDVEGMLKFFSYEIRRELSLNSKCYIKIFERKSGGWDAKLGHRKSYTYKIKYINGKSLTITDTKNHNYKYYDFAQFFGYTSLNNAAGQVIKDHKDIGIDASKSSRPRYLIDHQYKLDMIKYCLQDCYLTAQLAEYIHTHVNQFVKTKNYQSCASIAQQFIMERGYTLPENIKDELTPWLRTYYGGRFELFKRGYFKNVNFYDLKSAYPAHMTTLKILTEKAQFITGDEYDPKAIYGAYCIDLEVPDDDYMPPVPTLNHNGILTFKTGLHQDYWTDKPTLDYLIKYGYEFTVKICVQVYDEDAQPILKKHIEKLYSVKEDKKLSEGYRMAAKVIMNSIYGKMIQLGDDVVAYNATLDELDEMEKQGVDYDVIHTGKDGIYITKHNQVFKAGKMYCPIYASYLTSHTRVQLMEAARKVGLENLVGFHTDSIITLEKLTVKEKVELGDWDIEQENIELGITKVGVYEKWSKDGDLIKRKARGMGRVDSILDEVVTVKRRESMKQATRKGDYTKQNIISTRTQDNTLNSDVKRDWDEPLTQQHFKDKKWIDSKPKTIKCNDKQEVLQ